MAETPEALTAAEANSAVKQLRESLTPLIKTNPRVAFASGMKAKHMGFQRISPFYEDPAGDFFFLAAFDGLKWEECTAKWNEDHASL